MHAMMVQTWNPKAEQDVFYRDPLISVHWPKEAKAIDHITSPKDTKV